MIGELPRTVNIGNKIFEIRTDFRDILNIFEALNDEELSIEEKWWVALICFYPQYKDIKLDDREQALDKLIWFINGGKPEEESTTTRKPTYSWEQDEQIIFSAINKVANKEIRAVEYCHWWTFLGYFNEIGDGTFATTVSIRDKKNKGKKLESYEKEFYRDNKSMVDLKQKLSKEDKDFLAELDIILKGGSE